MTTETDASQLSGAQRAAVALEYAREDPARARAEAAIALRLAEAEDDTAAAAVAERALGVAARTEGDLGAALRHLRRAVRIAERHGLAKAAAHARVSLFGTLALRGDFAAALREADRAAVGLRGVDRAQVEMQRAMVLMMQGVRLDEALSGLQRALPALRRAGETSLEAFVLENRGLVQCYRGELAKAEADLRTAERLHRSLGRERLAAATQQNLGFVAARRGDLPAALAWFDRADAFFRAHGIVDAMGLRDRCEALLGARLVDEARRTAEEAVAALQRQGVASHLAEANLMLAEAALLDSDPATAQAAAQEAAQAFGRQRRPRHRQLAVYLQTKAAWQAGERSARLLTAARRSARTLEEYGWAAAAQDAHLIAGQVALELGRPIIARRELTSASRGRSRAPVAQRIRARQADALLRLAAGDRRGAERSARAGMDLLERHRALLGATDLRVHASAHAAELSELGLRLAIEDASASRVLRWAERSRAGTLALPPATPPADRRLRTELAQLRQVLSDAERAALEGRRTSGLLRRQAQLERSVRDLARHAAGAGGSAASQSVSGEALSVALDGRALVEFAEVAGRLHVVTLVGLSLDLTALGPVAEVMAEAEALRFALRRLAGGRGSTASQGAAQSAFDHARKRIDDLLIAPIAGRVGDRPLVIVPTGSLHALPWSALPSCEARAVAVAPSARLWQRAMTAADRTPAPGRVALIGGPEVPWADAEIAAVGGGYPKAIRLTGARATVKAVAAALDGAGLGHVVAHGRFRTDNPLLSSLRLADGPLTVYDLEGLRRAPSLLVLSACDSGLSDVHTGDELRGLVAALFMQGTRTVIAPVTPVPDEATRSLMVALHGGLASGKSPAAALAGAQANSVGTAQARAAAAGFVCFGAA
ncbi:MAG TPA: CHAT domain-containing protein [Egibacteraceae bacterium]|nr:CHAT domain-containing protein [Egibacteraceae bacterium]